jgi:RNA polymerase sporulation-specific sigma factor
MKQYDGIKDEELISRFKNGESEILDYLMEKYKNMVRKKARTMFLIGGENDDLIQEGMIGLFKAVRDYQPDRDAAFQTFASICVDRQIYNAIQSSTGRSTSR